MTAATALDRVIGYLWPGTALRRMAAREMLARAYEGASQRDGWRPRRAGASSNLDHTADAASLRARSRALVQNVPYIQSGMDALVANVVGVGITPRSLARDAEAVDALWSEWAPLADADGLLDIYALQSVAYRAMEQDGEVLLRLRPRRPEDGLPVPLQVQVLEIDWLDSTKNETRGPATIINGIEYDVLGRVSAYWLYDAHPGDIVIARSARRTSSPVQASRIIHLFRTTRPGQGRGFPRLSSIIARTRDLQVYEDAELARKNLETRLSVLASGDVSAMGMGEGQDAATVRATGELGTIGSGSVVQVPSGMNLTVVEPKSAPGYVPYLSFNLHLIAAGMGVTYEMLTGDMSGANFSSARVALIEFRRRVEQLQWLTLIPKALNPIWRAFIDAAVLSGKLRSADYRVDWSTPKFDYVNPDQEVAADLKEIGGGLCSISEKLRRRGYAPELVFAEMKSDIERLRADGTLDFMLQVQTGKTEAAASATPQASARDAVGLVLQGVEAAQRMAPAPAAPPTPQAPPVVNNYVQVPEQRHEIHNHVAPPVNEVRVQNDVHVPETQVQNHVHVPEQRAADPTPVTVVNEVTVSPAAVTVVDNHPTRAVQTVERDGNDEIVQTVTRYERDK